MIEFVFPWPLRPLSPNFRGHWSQVAKAKKFYRTECWAIAKQAKVPKVSWDGPVHVWITFYPPDRRARDDDNMIASFKAGRDGLADALGVDDKRFRIHVRVAEETGGMVKVRLTETIK